MAVTFRSASGGQSSTAALAASVTQPSGAAAGDMVIAGLTVKDTQTFTAKSGWTLEANANANSNVSTTATYRRVLDGTESWPISFAWTGSSVKYAWVAAAFTPGTGNTMTVDGEAAVKVDTTATTHTANAKTAVAASVCSVIFNCHRNSASGATGATVTPPTNWTEPANGDQTTASGTTTALSQLGAEVCYRTGQSGTVTPGSCTLTLTGTQNTYHFLLTDPAPETSPALELSGFGSFTGIGAGDTINHVTATICQYASSASMTAPVTSCGTGPHADRHRPGGVGVHHRHAHRHVRHHRRHLRPAGHPAAPGVRAAPAGSGYIQYVDWATLTVNYTPAAGTYAATSADGAGAARTRRRPPRRSPPSPPASPTRRGGAVRRGPGRLARPDRRQPRHRRRHRVRRHRHHRASHHRHPRQADGAGTAYDADGGRHGRRPGHPGRRQRRRRREPR